MNPSKAHIKRRKIFTCWLHSGHEIPLLKKLLMRIFVTLLLSALMLSSCQQEPDEIIPIIQSTCKITTGLYYGGSGMINDSASFTYLNDKLSKLEGQDTYVLYNYTGAEITSRKFIEKFDNSLSRTDTIQYDGSKNLTKFTTWYFQDNFNPDTSRVIYTYQYQAGKLKTIIEATTLFGSSGIYEDTVINQFTWDAAGNISKLVYSDAGYQPFDSITYTYNSNTNYLKVIHPHFYLFDPFFEIHVGLMAHLSYFYSKNNVTAFHIYGGVDYQVNYGLDSTNKVTAVRLDNDEYMQYRYQCH
jgi:hypothetical protein